MNQVNDSKAICNKEGVINEYYIGWSSIPFKDCTINQSFLKKKTWNTYMWMNDEFIFNFAIADIGYASIIHADFYEINSGKRVNKSSRYLFSKSIIVDDRINSYAYYKSKHKFINILRSSNNLNINLKWDNIDITSIIYLDYESLNVLIPWDYRHFHYTSKHMNLKTKGLLIIGSKKYDLNSSTCFIGYGRGVWKRKCEWDLLTSGFINDNNDYISINLVTKYTDGTGVNENSLKINDKIYKLNSDVKFCYDKEKQVINIKSLKSDEVNLEFKCVINHSKVNNVIIFKSKLKQIIGNINGYVKYKNKKIYFNNVIGWCENHFAKW
jgi:hypothetical protein